MLQLQYSSVNSYTTSSLFCSDMFWRCTRKIRMSTTLYNKVKWQITGFIYFFQQLFSRNFPGFFKGSCRFSRLQIHKLLVWSSTHFLHISRISSTWFSFFCVWIYLWIYRFPGLSRKKPPRFQDFAVLENLSGLNHIAQCTCRYWRTALSSGVTLMVPMALVSSLLYTCAATVSFVSCAWFIHFWRNNIKIKTASVLYFILLILIQTVPYFLFIDTLVKTTSNIYII